MTPSMSQPTAETKRVTPFESQDSGAARRPRRQYVCDRCGTTMTETGCKVTCSNCGNRFDCSDLSLYFD